MHLPEGMREVQDFPRAGLEHFLDAGYLYIGMDHFARPTDELAIAQRERTLHRISRVHDQGRRGPLRHGRERDQRHRRLLCAK